MAAHTDGLQELRSQHAAELESERLRLVEEAERAKKAALDDATAQFDSERDLLTHRTRRRPPTRMDCGSSSHSMLSWRAGGSAERLNARRRRRWMTRQLSLNRSVIF